MTKSDVRILMRTLLTTSSVATVFCALQSPASAQQARPVIDEARIGILAHDVPGLWSGWRIETPRPDFNAELIFSPSVNFLGGTVRPVVGGSYNTAGGTSKAYIDARWEYQTSLGVFFGLGVGAAIHNGYLDPVSLDHKALGSRVLFHFPARNRLPPFRWPNAVAVFRAQLERLHPKVQRRYRRPRHPLRY